MTITVTTPDGGTAAFPDGTDAGVIQSALRAKFATQVGEAQGKSENAGSAGIDQAAQQGTFGLSNYINAGATYAAQRLFGQQRPDSFATDLAISRGRSAGEVAASPVAGTVGGTLGGLVGGGALGTILKAARVVPGAGAVLDALAPKAGQGVRNVLKASGTGAAIGTGIGLANGQSFPEAAQSGAIAAVATPVVGKVASVAAARLTPVAQRAMQALATHLSETPEDLESAFQSFQHLTGSTPTMAELAGLKSQGLLKKLASANATIGEAATQAADLGGAPLHEQLAAMQASNANRPQTAAAIDALRNSVTDQAMNMPHPQTGMTLNQTHAPDPQSFLLDPRVEFAMSPNAHVNARIGRPSEILDRIAQNQQTIGDVDVVRKALRDQQNQFMRPAPGSMSAKDPLLAKEFGDLAQKVEGIGVRADPDYGKVLGNYRGLSRYSDGFQHGLTGNAFEDVPRDDTMLAASLKTPMGQAGYEHGNALYVAKAALDTIKSGTVNPQTSFNAGHATQAAMAASTGGWPAIYHAMRAIPGLHLPDNVQQEIARQLFDPRQTAAGIANLRRARVSDHDIRAFGAAVGGTAGGKIADVLSQGR